MNSRRVELRKNSTKCDITIDLSRGETSLKVTPRLRKHYSGRKTKTWFMFHGYSQLSSLLSHVLDCYWLWRSIRNKQELVVHEIKHHCFDPGRTGCWTRQAESACTNRHFVEGELQINLIFRTNNLKNNLFFVELDFSASWKFQSERELEIILTPIKPELDKWEWLHPINDHITIELYDEEEIEKVNEIKKNSAWMMNATTL